jgi:membrane-associated phospholipid phosphatase
VRLTGVVLATALASATQVEAQDQAVLMGTGAVLWLQSWASAPLTVLMNAVSLLGYTRVYLLIALLVAVSYRRHAGAALLLLLTLTAAVTDAAKTTASLPRPDGVDSAVRTLSLTSHPELLPAAVARMAGVVKREPHHPPSVDDEDSAGFPSGHVAAATAFLIGLVPLVGWRRAGLMLAVWVPLMALSRMYLGRHFPADVIGGLAVGLIASAIAWRLRLHLLDHQVRGTNVALRMCAIAAAIAVSALLLRLPAPSVAGQLLGAAVGVLVIVGQREHLDELPTPVRFAHAIAATTLLAITWWGVPAALEALGQSPLRGPNALVAGALPIFVALALPAVAQGLFRRRGATAA